MPFDGAADWAGVARRLRAHRYRGELTFELTRVGKPGRSTHERLAALSPGDFYALAYERASRFRALFLQETE